MACITLYFWIPYVASFDRQGFGLVAITCGHCFHGPFL
jgi:hypothetical protein